MSDENAGKDNATNAQAPHDAPRKKTRPVVVVLVVIIIACLVGAGFGISQLLTAQKQISDAANTENLQPATPEGQADLAQNPIDFASLQEQNADIYAWVYVPGTNVNHAVLRHPTDNAFYLSHDVDKAENVTGAVFSESFNTKDFQDAVTVLYGHNSKNDAMFSTLHYFEDKAFFKENKNFYVYVPGHILTYKIVSAFTADDRHILYRYQYFQTYDQLRSFEKEILDPHSIQQHTRDVKLDDASKIVVLSTCNSGALEQSGRYLVCGVMVDDQPTE